jgi:maleate isomerase
LAKSLHFSRLIAHGPTGTLEGQEARNRSYLQHLDDSAALLALVQPDVMVLAHTASSYGMSSDEEAQLVSRMEANTGSRFITAAGAVLQALQHLGVRRLALATPYAEDINQRGKKYLEVHGFEVAGYGRLQNIRNIYEETAERAYKLARSVDTDTAEAVFISGTGRPTLSVLDILERDLGKPVLSSATAMMWLALRTARIGNRCRDTGVYWLGSQCLHPTERCASHRAEVSARRLRDRGTGY